MDVSSYVDNLGREFAALVETGGPEVRELVERAAGTLESAIRLTMLEVLSAAADEITRELAPGSVELRLRGREPGFVVTPPPGEPVTEEVTHEADYDSDSATARINFRLPEQLKAAIEAAAGEEGRSVNAWLIRVSGAALRQRGRVQHAEKSSKRGKQSFTGWVS